jgi:eukaryotic-like serine/threonine-protein kinase
VAFYGFSLGAMFAPIYTALDTRFKASILLSGGLDNPKRPPEVETINFAPRSIIPTLMVNGRNDFRFPYETSQVPLFRLLGTPHDAKRHTLSDDGHIPARNVMIREMLTWLDRYLGPVR